jgi:hypothetical protein
MAENQEAKRDSFPAVAAARLCLHSCSCRPLPGALDRRLEYLVESDLFVVEDAIGRFEFGPSLASRRDAQLGSIAQGGQQRDGALVQAGVAQIHGVHFLTRPIGDRGVTPAPKVLTPSSNNGENRLFLLDFLAPFKDMGYNEGNVLALSTYDPVGVNTRPPLLGMTDR